MKNNNLKVLVISTVGLQYEGITSVISSLLHNMDLTNMDIYAEKLQAAMICKGARTLVGSPDGKLYLNMTGNSGMATAGSGDVLTGILAGLLAQGMDAFSAACAGVYLHGCAGDGAAHKKSEYGVTAGALIDELDHLMPKRSE